MICNASVPQLSVFTTGNASHAITDLLMTRMHPPPQRIRRGRQCIIAFLILWLLVNMWNVHVPALPPREPLTEPVSAQRPTSSDGPVQRFYPPHATAGDDMLHERWAAWRLWSFADVSSQRPRLLEITPRTVVIQFSNRKAFSEMVDSGELTPSKRFGYTGELFVGFRKWIGNAAAPAAATEAFCSSIALTTACSAGFRVLTIEKSGAVLCEVFFPVVNKDMVGALSDDEMGRGSAVRRGYHKTYLPATHSASLFLFLFGPNLLREGDTGVGHPRLHVDSPAAHHVVVGGRDVSFLFAVLLGDVEVQKMSQANGDDETQQGVHKTILPTCVGATQGFMWIYEATITLSSPTMMRYEKSVAVEVNRRCHVVVQLPETDAADVLWEIRVSPTRRHTTDSDLKIGGRLLVARSGAVALRLPPNSHLSSGLSCAPYALPTEYCVRNLDVSFTYSVIAPVGALERSGAPPPQYFRNQMLSLVSLTDDVDVVDGHVTYVRNQSSARFPSVVLHLLKGNHSSSIRLKLVAPFCSRCQQFIEQHAGSSAIQLTLMANLNANDSTLEASTARVRQDSPSVPILISMSVHQHVPQLLAQLANIRAYIGARQCVVVLHLSPMWRVTAKEMTLITNANATQGYPTLYLNPHRYHLSFSLLFAVQLRNVVYVAQELPWVQFSHVLCVSSNEVFLRHGVVRHIQAHDLSHDSVPQHFGSVRDFHSYPNAEAELPYIDRFGTHLNSSSLRDASRAWLGRIPPYGVLGSLFGTSSRVEWGRAPTEQSFTEGSYFRKDIALLLSDELQALFPLHEVNPEDARSEGDDDTSALVFDPTTFSPKAHCFPNWFSWSEVVPAMLLRSIRCSHHGRGAHSDSGAAADERVGSSRWKAFVAAQQFTCAARSSTVAWNRPNWAAMPRDVHWMRCSPFDDGLFAIKRHVFGEENPLFRLVRGMQQQDEIDHDTEHWPRRVSSECYRHFPLTFGL